MVGVKVMRPGLPVGRLSGDVVNCVLVGALGAAEPVIVGAIEVGQGGG